MIDDDIHVRLSRLVRYNPRGDRELLERMWVKFDAALVRSRLEIRDEVLKFGTVRVVTALGLIQVHVDASACDVWAYAIQEDGSRCRIGRGLPATRLFFGSWWMRFAFQRWAPECSRIDFVEDPLDRPSNVELDTCRMLMGRLNVDPRYWTLSDDFDAATGIPAFAVALAEEGCPSSRGLERVSDAWHLMEGTNRATRNAMGLAG